MQQAITWVNINAVLCRHMASFGLNTLRLRQNGRHCPDDIFKWIFLNENVWISIKISMKFVPKVPINNIPALVQIMAWHRSGDKPLSESMMNSLLTHICVTQPQWVNELKGFVSEKKASKSFLLNWLIDRITQATDWLMTCLINMSISSYRSNYHSQPASKAYDNEMNTLNA